MGFISRTAWALWQRPGLLWVLEERALQLINDVCHRPGLGRVVSAMDFSLLS